MPKKKIQNEIVCEVKAMPVGDVAKVEPYDPPRVTDVGHKKVRKPLSQESLDKLKLAREMAYKKRMELKAQKESPETIPLVSSQSATLKNGDEVVSSQSATLENGDEVKSDNKLKKKKGKKPIVIVEQSDSESEDEQVVYIKRASKKKEKQVVIETPQEAPQEPPIQFIPTNPQRYGYNIPYNAQRFSNRRHF